MQLPNTKIYVNSIFRVNSKAISKSPALENVPQFNAAIMDMCNKLGLVYIDASSIVDDSLYEGVNSKAISKSPALENVPQFNAAIMDMCNKLGLVYIDASSIVDDSLYEGDGIHFKPEFNKRWVELLIQVANL